MLEAKDIEMERYRNIEIITYNSKGNTVWYEIKTGPYILRSDCSFADKEDALSDAKFSIDGIIATAKTDSEFLVEKYIRDIEKGILELKKQLKHLGILKRNEFW